MTKVSFKVALDAKELRSTASLLVAMAIGLENMHKVDPQIQEQIPDNTTSPAVAETPPATSNEQKQTETTTTADVVTLSGVELDGLGLPWDERINGASKLKIKSDNSWKLKRNLDPAFVEQVREELRQLMAAQAAPVTGMAELPATDDGKIDYEAESAEIEALVETDDGTAPPPPPGNATAAPPPPASNTVTKYITDDGGEFTADELLKAGWTIEQIHERESVEIEVAPEPGPVTTTATAEAELTFPVFMGKVTQAIAAGSLTDEVVNGIVTKHGVASLPLLAARPDIMALVNAELFG